MSSSDKREADARACWRRATACGSGGTACPGCRSGSSVCCCSALIALLPLYTPPFLDTPGHQLRRHHGAVRHGRDHRDRPQRRGRPGRPARPRLRRLLRRRRLHRRAAHQPRQPVEQGRPQRVLQHSMGVAVLRAAGDGVHRAGRPDPRHPDTAAARRLSGDRHAWVRRDHPADGRQPGRHHQRPARPQRGGVPALGGEREAARRASSPVRTRRATRTTAPGGSGSA